MVILLQVLFISEKIAKWFFYEYYTGYKLNIIS